jgi:diguanylate cyclase (GGDEF)-like protein
MRSSDLLGRLGGEEFAAVLSDTSRDKAVAVAERIRESFAQLSQDVDGRPVCATVSIGLVHCQEAALDVPELLAQADQALYFAKEHGRNRVEIATLDMVRERAADSPATSVTSVGTITAKSAA